MRSGLLGHPAEGRAPPRSELGPDGLPSGQVGTDNVLEPVTLDRRRVEPLRGLCLRVGVGDRLSATGVGAVT